MPLDSGRKRHSKIPRDFEPITICLVAKVAVMHFPGHQRDESVEALGDWAADTAAKQASLGLQPYSAHI